MKRLLFSLLIVVLVSQPQTSIAQLAAWGIVKGEVLPYRTGDTIPVYGMKEMNKKKYQYFIQGENQVFHFVSQDRVELLPTSFNYWESVWFANRAADIKKDGWDRDLRDELNEDAIEYYSNAKKNDMLFEDDMLTDYLYQIVYNVFPEDLIKHRNRNLSVVVVKSTTPESFSFDNGMIVLTTAELAQMENEEQLVKLLTERVSNVVLEHNLLNTKKAIRAERRANMWGNLFTVASAATMAYTNNRYGTYFDAYDALDMGISAQFISGSILQSIGAKYSSEQYQLASSIADQYLQQHPGKFDNEKEAFLANISGAISYTAWQEYHLKNYDYALSLVDRLYVNHLATEEDFLLLSKVYRKTINTEEGNNLALGYLKEAQKLAITPMIEIDKEAGLLYLRQNDKENAKKSFQAYRDNLIKLQEKGNNVNSELKSINQIMFKHRLNGEVEYEASID
ncbi:hypothetical protein KIH41_05390 [Litoribacter ruber]|uniref:M48 family metalloprotease n=1 Tax=Litoribacter ruber TaxID=702568 RepID=A0AAP2CEV5_9BACT|nr:MULTISPECIES: hypothetical protein [Litoribacter]MBS9523128.1 hypothetical protein [Litoribacter alkaliphilus]MBT0810709.1 hypothetical protein [Litoribacter ruber]